MPGIAYRFLLAVPTIALILAMDDAHPVMRDFKLHFKSTSWNVQASLNWIRDRSFEPSAALQEMLTPAFAALNAHEFMRADDSANRKIWGPGMILFQLLAVQHSLGEPWNLNGDIFLQIQAGNLVSAPPQAVEGLHAMWKAIDPIVRARELRKSSAEFVWWEHEFKTAHAVYESPSPLVFYRYTGNPQVLLPRAPIHITHAGRQILSLQDLPVAPVHVPRRREREIDGEEVFVDEPVPKRRKQAGKKYVHTATPPGVRRSGRLKKGN
ncbi:hypothetical protein K438DRAFT_1998806 [Mycena galopus ATCC 62051]|nr:hypothetical protein K438DRAFT_1998806 [Mycena galopus ATCC 62051]